MKSLTTTLITIIFLGACATTYQPKGATGGFTDTQLDENLWKVSVNGNGFTDSSTVNDYALLRASELTLEKGFKYFYVASEDSNELNSVAKFGSNTSTTYGNIDSFGNFNARTNYSSPTYVPVTKYENQLIYLMLNEKPENYFVYNAQFIYDSLSAKYIK